MRLVSPSLLAALLLLPALPSPAGPAAERVRVQVLYDPATGQVQRHQVRVLAPFAETDLDFSWEPAAGNHPGIDPDGFANGMGVLTWRIPGTPSYDPRAFHSRYEGHLLRGSPEGPGRLSLRDGSWQEGHWQAGRLEGEGRWQHSDGSYYEGTFRQGQPQGQGLLRSARGWSYSGPFDQGQPHGTGVWHQPGEAAQPVRMEAGTPLPAAGAQILPAQGAGLAAGVEVSVVTNARVALEQDVSYRHINDGETLHLVPSFAFGDPEELIRMWNGGEIAGDYLFQDWTPAFFRDTRAFLDVTVATRDGKRVKLSSLDLVADVSQPYLRPMLSYRDAPMCVGHQPWLDLINRGWGAVEEPSLRVSYGLADHSGERSVVIPQTDWIEVPVSAFDEGTTLDFGPSLARLGVDLATLSGNRFTCPSQDLLESCGQNILSSVDFGQLSGLVTADHAVRTALVAELSYTWTDATGTRIPATDLLYATVSLAHIELDSFVAEHGAGGAFAAPAPDFQDIELPAAGTDYRVNLPVRGNPNIASTTVMAQLHSPVSATHQLRIEASLGDGSVASSMPVALYYLAPRDTRFTTLTPPAACFLRPL